MHKHFIDIRQLGQADLLGLIEQAQSYITNDGIKRSNLLQGKTIANLFYEPSTRTRCSFELAAKALGATVLNLDINSSSTVKGETELDTVLNLQAMGVDGFVIRHKENGMVQNIADNLNGHCVVVSAGNGTTQHPSQAILDMLTIAQHKKTFQDLTVAIIGDLRYSRVAYSDIYALHTLGAKEIRLIAPQQLLPDDVAQLPVNTYLDLESGLKNVDIIMTLRLQKERHEHNVIDEKSFFTYYGLTTTRLALATTDAWVMHPGPMNRGVEITDEVASGPRSLILQQAKNGVPARMAIFSWLFTAK